MGSHSRGLGLAHATPWLIGALLLGAVAVYLHGLTSPWLFDDHPNLLDNPLVQIAGGAFDEWRTAAFSSGSGLLRRPVSMLSFAANHVISGRLDPAVIKATNVAIHFAVGALVFLLCREILLAREAVGDRRRLAAGPLALIAAAIWVLHPLHVSTVLYAVQRMAQLSSLFTVLGLWLFVSHRRTWAERGATAGEVLALGLWLAVITALATLSKENGILLPWLVAAVEVSVFRGRWGGRQSRVLSGLAQVLLALPLAAALVYLSFYPDWLDARYASRDFTLEQRLLTQARLLWHYLAWFCLPDLDAMGLFHDDIPLSNSLLEPLSTFWSLAAWAGSLALALLLGRRFPLVLFALLFYLVGHSVESGPLPLEMAFEHRNYLPSVGIALLLAAAIDKLAAAAGEIDPRALALAPLVALLALLFIRVDTWSDEVRLSQVSMVNHPDSVRSRALYANTLVRLSKDPERSVRDRERALAEARHHFELVHIAKPGNLASLVMLYQLDSTHYPQLEKVDEWRTKIEVLAPEKTRQATDINALSALMRCLGGGTCRGPEGTADRILASIEKARPGWPRLGLLRHDFLTAAGASPEERKAALERALAATRRGNIRLQYELLRENAAAGDLSGVYRAARDLMRLDRNRWQLPVLLAPFAVERG